MSENVTENRASTQTPPSESPPQPQERRGWGNIESFFQNFFIFALIALAASCAEISNFAISVYENTNPNPQATVAGSNSVLGAELGVSDSWQTNFESRSVREVPLFNWELFDFYTLERPGVNLVIDGSGSVAGYRDAVDGKAHGLISSESLADLETDTNVSLPTNTDIVCAAEIGYDVITFVTNVNNSSLSQIELRDMRSILNGSITNWSAVGGPDLDIQILARSGSGTTNLVLQRFTGSPNFKPEVSQIECSDNNDCLNRVLNIPGALYWVSAAWLRTQPPKYVEPVLIQDDLLISSNPLADDFDINNYTPNLIRPLYMYVFSGNGRDAEAVNTAVDFMTFVRSIEGQQIIEEHAFYTYLRSPQDPTTQPQLPTGFGQQDAAEPPVTCLNPG